MKEQILVLFLSFLLFFVVLSSSSSYYQLNDEKIWPGKIPFSSPQHKKWQNVIIGGAKKQPMKVSLRRIPPSRSNPTVSSDGGN